MERATRQPPARHMHNKYNKPARNSTTNSSIPRIITIIPASVPHQNKQNNLHTNQSDRILDTHQRTHVCTTIHNSNKYTNNYELCFHNFLLLQEDIPSTTSLLQLFFLNTHYNNESTREQIYSRSQRQSLPLLGYPFTTWALVAAQRPFAQKNNT